VLDYWFGIHSDAMQFAEGRIRGSASIRQRVGEVHDVRLKLWGYSNQTGYAKDSSELRLRVTGARGAIDIELRLEGKDGGPWKICGSDFPL
jgi:hypothetical protein